MRKILKGIFTAVISFALTLLTVVAGVIPATISVSAEESVATYEQTNVMDDLKGSVINGKEFSLTDYNFDAFKETKVLSFVEYCYSFYQNMQDNYGLYVYVYNPKGLKFVENSSLNQIQMAYGLQANQSYVKYPLLYLNSSTETNYEGLFYKFKVVLTGTQRQELLQGLNSSDRAYRVSGVELLEQGKANATEYSVATTYHYSGYAAGYGSNPNAENTLVCKCEESQVLSLNVHPTVYRPKGTNGKNDYTQDSLHTVYFAVPNDVLRKYGRMSAVHATWRDAVLNPALVTGNANAYNAFLPYLGKNIGKETSELEYGYMGAYKLTGNTSGLLQITSYCGYRYNRNYIPDRQEYGSQIETLYMMFHSADRIDSADNHTVSSEDITKKLMESKDKYGGALINGKYSAKLFESVSDEITDVNIQADENFSLTSETISTKWWHLMFHRPGTVVSNKFDGIQAIYAVKDTDLEGTDDAVADKLYIAKNDYKEFKEFYNANKNFSTVYLFRYQVSDYIAQEATLFERSTFLGAKTWDEVDTNAYFFQQTVNLDFDIIDVTFSNGSVDTVIPVVSNPIDVIPDATPPVYTQSDKKPNWWLIIAALILLIVLIVSLPNWLPLIIKGIVWLVTLPFKLIAKLFKGDKDNKE